MPIDERTSTEELARPPDITYVGFISAGLHIFFPLLLKISVRRRVSAIYSL